MGILVSDRPVLSSRPPATRSLVRPPHRRRLVSQTARFVLQATLARGDLHGRSRAFECPDETHRRFGPVKTCWTTARTFNLAVRAGDVGRYGSAGRVLAVDCERGPLSAKCSCRLRRVGCLGPHVAGARSPSALERLVLSEGERAGLRGLDARRQRSVQRSSETTRAIARASYGFHTSGQFGDCMLW